MSDYAVRVVADSVAPSGRRLTTITATYPRFIHSEIMTHRDRERNAASSRAIPWPVMMAAVVDAPVVPIRFGSEQRGMQTGGEIADPEEARRVWLEARDDAVRHAQRLAALGVHKSICNRLTEPWMWITVVMTATEWRNFFRLRCHPDAEIHFQKIAYMIRDALASAEPTSLREGEWHLPFVSHEDGLVDVDEACRVSVARCARVSYLTHEGRRDKVKDLELYERLVQGSGFGHWSPHGHVARAERSLVRSGPFVGWTQFRKLQPGENEEG